MPDGGNKPFELKYTPEGEVVTDPLVLYPRHANDLLAEEAKLRAALLRAAETVPTPLKNLEKWLNLLSFRYECWHDELRMSWRRQDGFFSGAKYSVNDAIGITFENLLRQGMEQNQIDHLYYKFHGRRAKDVALSLIEYAEEGLLSNTELAYLKLLARKIEEGLDFDISFLERPSEGFSIGIKILQGARTLG